MTTPADVHEVRDPELPGRLLSVERDALLPLLRARGDGDFTLPVTACPGWTVRDVLAHCSAALARSRPRLPAPSTLAMKPTPTRSAPPVPR